MEGKRQSILDLKGNSMEPDFKEGDIVIFSPRTEAKHKDLCFVKLTGEIGTFKQIFISKTKIRLHSLNPKYKNKSYKKEEIYHISKLVRRIAR